MRPTKELKQALEQLSLQADSPERQAQIEVIRNCHSERKVFELYVMKAEVKNESVFYAARDAAQFVAGKLELETLLGMDVPPVEDEPEPEEEKVTVSKAYLEELERRIEQMEIKMLKIEGIKKLVQDDHEESLTFPEVCYYIGCSRDTLTRWTKEGILNAEKRGRYYYYKSSDLINSSVVRTFIRNKRKQ